jgi:crotonobetaine/carnitine-CoA ligase
VTAHAGVLEAAAIGVKAGEGASAEDEILVCLVAREGCEIDPAGLLGWCEERMPYFALPRYLRVMESLPKTPTERVRKVELRDAGLTADTFDREGAAR